VLFGLTYLVSWLLMGLGVFLAFRVALDLRRAASRGVVERAVVAGSTIRIALVVLVVFASLGITYAGAYTFYNLMVR
jgi:amino acid permease